MYSDDQHELDRQLRRERHYGQMDDGEMEDGMDDHERYLDIEDVKGKLSNWISQPRTQRWIRRIFLLFLKTFKDDNNVNVYEQRIQKLVTDNKQSLEINYSHLSNKSPTLAIWLAEEPGLVIPILNDVAFELVTELYQTYEQIHKEIYIRVRDLPIEDSVRELR